MEASNNSVTATIIEKPQEDRIKEEELLIKKVECLESLLSTRVIDEDKTISEDVWKNAWDEEDLNKIKGKIMKLINKF